MISVLEHVVVVDLDLQVLITEAVDEPGALGACTGPVGGAHRGALGEELVEVLLEVLQGDAEVVGGAWWCRRTR